MWRPSVSEWARGDLERPISELPLGSGPSGVWVSSKGSGKSYSLIKLLKNYEKYPIYDNEGHKLDMCVILFCPTILSTANPMYDTLKYLDEDDIIMDCSENKTKTIR